MQVSSHQACVALVQLLLSGPSEQQSAVLAHVMFAAAGALQPEGEAASEVRCRHEMALRCNPLRQPVCRLVTSWKAGHVLDPCCVLDP